MSQLVTTGIVLLTQHKWVRYKIPGHDVDVYWDHICPVCGVNVTQFTHFHRRARLTEPHKCSAMTLCLCTYWPSHNPDVALHSNNWPSHNADVALHSNDSPEPKKMKIWGNGLSLTTVPLLSRSPNRSPSENETAAVRHRGAIEEGQGESNHGVLYLVCLGMSRPRPRYPPGPR